MRRIELARDECLGLLAEGVIGRVVCTEGALPAVHPVVYRLGRDEVVFRTGGAAGLVPATRGRVVGFQVDAYDPATRTGWSVLGVGVAYEVTDPERLATLADRPPTAGAPERDDHTMAVPLQRLTGRRLLPTPADGDGPLA